MPRTLLRTLAPYLAAGIAAVAGIVPAKQAAALSPYLVVPASDVAEATASYRYANMTGAEALAELDKRKVPYKQADPIDGVTTPIRLTGKLQGVHIHSSIAESERATSMYEVLDARLALALDDFAKILARHDIDEVVHYSLFRPNVPRADHGVKESTEKAAEKKPAAGDAKSTAKQGKSEPPAALATGSKTAGSAVEKPATGVANAAKPAVAALKTSGAAPKSAPATTKPSAPAAAKPSASAAAKPKGLPALPSSKLPTSPSKSPSVGTQGAKQKTPTLQPKTVSVPAAPKVTKVAQKAPPAARARAATPPAAAKTPAKAAPATATTATAKQSVHTHSRQTWAAPGTRHPAGLAIDVAMLKKKDGTWISVATHFHGKIGDKTCGEGVRPGDTPEARELRSIMCEAYDLGVFTYVLSPNYNAAHFDHFHMEIRPTVKWFLYQ
ncbi:MAG: extensin family protein [Polyangiaceae bacterium]|nr:extensin family protein [Polyangiaceae bacterium]